MDRWLPSRKLVLFFGALIILIGLFFIFKNIDNNILYTKDLDNNNLSKKVLNSDFDNDGLKNWEESLWKTDPNNPDTDGDGTNDNDEILQNRNPLIVGPNDQLENDISSVKNEILNKSLTTTEKISRDLIGGYLNIKTSGELNEQNQEELLNSIIKNEVVEDQKDKYFLSNIQIIQNNDFESFQKYNDSLLKILLDNSDMEYDLIVLKRAIDNSDRNELNKLNIAIKFYKNIQKEMLEMKVPFELKERHLNILNYFNKIENNVKNMLYVFDDPINVLIILNNYMENEKNIMEEFDLLWNYLKNKGIINE